MKNLFDLFIKDREAKRSSWKLIYDWFKPAQEGLREALCTLGNGYFATRGAAPESIASRIHYPGTYMAGLYNKTPTQMAGKTIYNEDLVNCPNWLYITFRIGKHEWVTTDNSKIISYHQELDMKRGLLTRKMVVANRKGQRTKIETSRFVHMADQHRAALRYSITPENYEGWIVVRASLDGRVQNTGVARYRKLNCKHLKPFEIGNFGRNGSYLSVKTSQSNVTVSQAAKINILADGKKIRPVNRILSRDKKGICQEFGIYVNKKKKYEIEKLVSIYSSKDEGVKNPLISAINSVRQAKNFDVLYAIHKKAWAELWKKFDIEVGNDDFIQRILRLHMFHLLQTASKHNKHIDAGLPARGLHGEAYRGHVFWDELFVLPIFDLNEDVISKALLLYRYRRLEEARKYAADNGYKGSMFPWQSSSTGVEETQIIHLNPMSGKWDPDHSCIQRHVSFAIALNVWGHWVKTNDKEFMSSYGCEMLLSIAQFGASLSKFSPKDGKYHTEGLMGPDEFHEKFPGSQKSGFKDNAYTNLLIVWTIMKAQKSLEILSDSEKKALLEKLGITDKDFSVWGDITKRMNVVISEEGIISQFDGYFKLKELDWAQYKAKYGNIQRMDRILKAEGKSPDQYKAGKQADVLMLFYVLPLSEIKKLFGRLGYRFDKNILKKNYEYYVKRTSHGSTLSKVVHCYVAHILGRHKEAWQWFLEVMKSDIYDTQGGTTLEGIHAGVMGGSINIVMKAFAGINILEDRIKIDPSLPKHWKTLKVRFNYRKNRVSVMIEKDLVAIRIRGSNVKAHSIPMEIKGNLHHLVFGKTHKIFYGKTPAHN